MIFISHRGNLDGSRPLEENHPDYIEKALNGGYVVEIDVWSYDFGNDFMANVGGALHGHPEGTQCGTRAMKQAIDKEDGSCYRMALDQLRNK